MRRVILVVALAVVWLGGVGGSVVARADGVSAWWGVSSGARPTNLGGSVGSGEVLQLVVSATKGEVVLADPRKTGQAIEELLEVLEGKRSRSELRVVSVIPFNAEASVVQRELETRVYPDRRVLVTGGPGDEEGSKPYVVTFPGQSSGEGGPGLPVVELPFVNGEFAGLVGGEALSCEGAVGSGCTGLAGAGELQVGKRDQKQVVVDAENRGDGPTSGVSTVVDHLPPGLEAVAIDARAGSFAAPGFELGPVDCVLSTLTCTFVGALPPYEVIEVHISVVPTAGAKEGELNGASVSGGGAVQGASAVHALATGAPERFGIEDYSLVPENVGGSIDTQAGSHPFQLTSVVTLNTQTPDGKGHPRTVALPKDIVAELPPGQVGNPTPFQQCTDAQFAKHVAPPAGGSQDTSINECPAASAVGVASVVFNEPNVVGFDTVTAPIFNMTPRAGEPVRFGFLAAGVVSAFLDGSVRTGSDYGVNISSSSITETAWTLGVKLTFWGVPGSPVHDSQRGWACLQHLGGCPTTNPASPPPFLVSPSSCAQAYSSTVHADSWAAGLKPSEQAEPVTYQLPEAIDGCNRLPFEPSIDLTPDGTAASTPTGLNVDVHVPQAAVLNAESLAESAVKDITVVLPEGLRLNPAAADGLAACSQAQVALNSPGEASCPDASKIANVTVTTPLLANSLKGFVYLAAPQNFAGPPQENPFESLVAMYLVVRDPVSGVLVKLAGSVSLSESGQVTASFKDNPELPFEDAELKFFGGDRAPLATPSRCGVYTTNALFAPWSGSEPAGASSSVQITTGPHESACPGASLAFSPSLAAGTTNINAGSFTPLTTTIGREDGQQDIQTVKLNMPPGVSGILSGVALCPEAQANAGSCGPESLIGHTVVSVGLGGDPFSVTGGQVFLTASYRGAPFGLSIVNPAVAGPFDLGKVVVRAKIEVDPHTAALTVTTDEIPHILRGIPLQIKHVNVTIDRPGFTFNPTNCSSQALTGAISSVEGASSAVSVPFQVTNCATLKFTPNIQVSTAGHASKANGASLLFKIAYPHGAMGSQSWFNEAKFVLPKQLPARLTTLQKACLAATFETNRGACPPASLIGHAVVHTPVLPVALTGPVYFVSYGGAKFPEAVMVLQGYGVNIQLHGETFISKTGLTSATFRNTPDVPFESIEVTIPTGPFSEFGANLPASAKYSFCGQKLVMPTLFKAQNGLEIHQNTPIAVTGCKTTTRAQKLAAAIKACHKQHKAKRAVCEQQARRRYGQIQHKKKR